MEGPDQQNYVSSLSGHQLPIASDGSRYYIIAHHDPGVEGWVSTTGIQHGFFAMRFLFRDDPDQQQLPAAETMLVPLAELKNVLPSDTKLITSEQRLEEISIRQQHIERRWRGH